MTRRVRFGVTLPMWDYHIYEEVGYDEIAGMAAAAERLGYDYVSVDDHLERGRGGRAFEALTTLSALAASTSRVRLMTTVLSAMYRTPSLVAKMAAVIDTISGGRVELGLGAGWKEEEARAYGIPWDGVKGRMDRLDDACRIILALWTQERATVSGRYFSVDGAVCNPRPVQRPHPPLWIGGGGEKRTLRIAAKYADGATFPGHDAGEPREAADYFAHKRDVLHRHCAEVGRDPAEIALACSVNLVLWGRSREAVEAQLAQRAAAPGLSDAERQRLLHSAAATIATPREAVGRLEALIGVGATYVMVTRPTIEGLQMFAEEVIPRFRSVRA